MREREERGREREGSGSGKGRRGAPTFITKFTPMVGHA